MNRVKCFWLERTYLCKQALRVYERTDEDCPVSRNGYHEAMKPLPDGTLEDHPDHKRAIRRVGTFASDAELIRQYGPYPTHCTCGYQFTSKAERHFHYRALYKREDGSLVALEDVEPGAMWNAWYYPSAWSGPDGRSIMVKLPDGSEWCIDSRASNCTMKEDDVHKCWIRHGEPPNLTVDKNGYTCAAGAGSIATTGYHGFLRNGYLESC